MNVPNQFNQTGSQIWDNLSEAEEVLVYYTPLEMHMLIDAFISNLMCQPLTKRYDHITLIGEFVVWVREHDVTR